MSASLQKRMIALGVMFALALVVVLINKFVDFSTVGERSEEEATPFPTPLPPLFEGATQDIMTRIRVTDNERHKVFDAELGADGLWIVNASTQEYASQYDVDQNMINGALMGLPSMSPTRILDGIFAPSDYGLDPPRYTIEFSLFNGMSYLLFLGDPAPGGTEYYAALKTSAQELYVVPGYSIDSVLGLIDTPPFMEKTQEPDGGGEEATAEPSGF